MRLPLGIRGRLALAPVGDALAPHWGALLALALFLVAGLAVLDDYGVTRDESYHRGVFLSKLTQIQGGTASIPTEHDNFYGGVFQFPLLFAEGAFGFRDARDVYLSRHLITHLFFLAGGLFAYLLALRLFGARLLALSATALLLLHPRLYAHSFFNAQDSPFVVAFVIALFLAHRAFRRETLAAFVLLGVGVGLLANLRIMGVVLLAAVPALRAMDFALARGWAERRRVLLTTGGFALGGALTIYALLPYLWENPLRRAGEWWTNLADHPTILVELFRGTSYRSADFPPEYLPFWFSISSPPFALMLGGVGAAAIFVAAARAPRAALRNGRLRFWALTAVCFAAPVFVVVLLDANMYTGWRHMHFLWAPFALLGAFGLRFLASAARRLHLRAAAYGIAGAGFAAAVVSMALVHPNQHVYFNFLVDRAAPDHLRWQYVTDYWGHSMRQGLEWIASDAPPPQTPPPAATARPTESLLLENALMLPESERERLAGATPFDVVPSGPRASWSRSARETHRVEAYGSTLWTFESRDDLREVYDAVRGREPMTEGAFDVYRVDGALALVMEPCAPGIIESEQSVAILRAFPVDPGDLPEWRRGRAFEPRVLPLRHYGAYFDGKCVASLPLPAYPIADFELAGLPELPDAADAQEKARRAREEGRLLARAAHRAAYDVYLTDGELAYVNDACDPAETAHPFHLNVYPEQVSDLPDERREQGYERFHFEFLSHGAFADGDCVAFFPLPDYPVAAVRTGQSDAEGGDLWLAEFWIDPERRLAESAAGASGDPVARGAFDVYLADGALVYVKEPCGQADTEARFFLHITPERVSDLPEDRRARGFDNLDFAFFPNGALFDGKCAARAALPDYAVASIRTGQHDGGGEIWSAEFGVGR